MSLNAVRARSTLVTGPPAENQDEVKKFQSFWGSKAEVRRFKDGAIISAVGKYFSIVQSEDRLICVGSL